MLELSTDLETRAESSMQEYDSLRSTIDEATEATRSEREALAKENRRTRSLCWILGVLAALCGGMAVWSVAR